MPKAQMPLSTDSAIAMINTKGLKMGLYAIWERSAAALAEKARMLANEPTALMRAAKNGDIDTVKRILAKSPDEAKKRNDDWMTALTIALSRGQMECAELLV